jgi:hypothetical protein
MANGVSTLVLHEHLKIDRCPHCRVAFPTLSKVWETITTEYDGTNQRHWRIYQCTGCGHLVSAYAQGWNAQVLKIFPSHTEADLSIPEKARHYINQCMDSLGSPAGAIMLAASAVDEMLKQKGFVGGSLYRRIDQAKKGHVITGEMALWAHQVRLEANGQRHSDEETPLPDKEDAKQSLDFVTALAEFLFVLPSKVKRGLEKPQGNSDHEQPDPHNEVNI